MKYTKTILLTVFAVVSLSAVADEDTFVFTGDIHAMRLSDSGAQVHCPTCISTASTPY